MFVEFNAKPASFTLSARVYSLSSFTEYTHPFNEAGLITKPIQTHSGDDHDTYEIRFDEKSDVYKAAVVVLRHYFYDNDERFTQYAADALNLAQELRLSPEENSVFFNVLSQKYQDLYTIQIQLQELAKFLKLDDSLQHFQQPEQISECDEAVSEITAVQAENKKLYDLIAQAARNNSEQYNDVAVKAIILAISSSYLKRNKKEVMDEADAAYHEHHNPAVEGQVPIQPILPIVSPLPHPDKIYPFIEPELLFPVLDKVKQYSHKSVNLKDVQTLDRKVRDLFANHIQTEKDLNGFTYYFSVIKRFFNRIFTKISDALSNTETQTAVEQGYDLAQNVDNIVNGLDVTDRAQKLHRYNSRPSPLIAVIYDKKLTEDEKVDLLEKLSLARPYRFASASNETRQNIAISGGEPEGSDAKVLKTIWERPPLHHAIEAGSLEEVAVLVRQGAALDATGDLCSSDIGGDGVTALHVAVSTNDFAKVKLLVDAGASVNALNTRGQSPLHAAKSRQIAEYLISHGANINLRDKEQNTPLHLAADRNNREVVEGLLAQKTIEVDCENNLGNTPLHVASHYGVPRKERRYAFSSEQINHSELCTDNMVIMRALVAKNAQVNRANKFGYTPLLLSINMGRDCLGDNSGTREVDFLLMKNKVSFLCEKGAETNHRSASDDIKLEIPGIYSNYHYTPSPEATPLLALYDDGFFSFDEQYSSDNKYFRQRQMIAEVLIQHKADPTLLGEENKSLLHLCAKTGDAEGLHYFLGLGLDPNYQGTSRNETPLHALYWGLNTSDEKYFSQKGKACVDVLLEFGANPCLTKPTKIKVNKKTQNPQLPGIYLQQIIIGAIFSNDNIFSQKAKEQGIDPFGEHYSGERRRELLNTLWKETGDKELEISLLPELSSHLAGEYNSDLRACNVAKDYLAACRANYLAQQVVRQNNP